MWPAWFPAVSAEDKDRPALVATDRSLSWAELLDQVTEHQGELQALRGKRVGLCMESTPQAYVRLLRLLAVDAHVFLLSADTSDDTLHQWQQNFRWAAVWDKDTPTFAELAASRESAAELNSAAVSTAGVEPPVDSLAVTILTSGTTGQPKAVQHTWASLLRPVRQQDVSNPVWLLTYRPHLYAGLQVAVQCLWNRGQLVMPPVDATAEQVVDTAATAGVMFASATPSYWRWLLTFAGDRALSALQPQLRQITLGGEAVDQPTLDALRRRFPDTRLVHIYATTELGRCFSVTDGLAGFPAAWLDRVSADGVEMCVRDDELQVRSANAMAGYDRAAAGEEGSDTDAASPSGSARPRTDWFATGDLVRIENQRVLFAGRKTDMINVGGNKVYPLEVERVIRQVPGVADACVYGEASSIVGQLVKCELVIMDGHDVAEVQAAVRQSTLDRLSPYQRPRLIDVVPQIARTSAGKVARRRD